MSVFARLRYESNPRFAPYFWSNLSATLALSIFVSGPRMMSIPLCNRIGWIPSGPAALKVTDSVAVNLSGENSNHGQVRKLVEELCECPVEVLNKIIEILKIINILMNEIVKSEEIEDRLSNLLNIDSKTNINKNNTVNTVNSPKNNILDNYKHNETNVSNTKESFPVLTSDKIISKITDKDITQSTTNISSGFLLHAQEQQSFPTRVQMQENGHNKKQRPFKHSKTIRKASQYANNEQDRKPHSVPKTKANAKGGCGVILLVNKRFNSIEKCLDSNIISSIETIELLAVALEELILIIAIVFGGDINAKDQAWDNYNNNRSEKTLFKYLTNNKNRNCEIKYSDEPTHFPTFGLNGSTLDIFLTNRIKSSKPLPHNELSPDHL
ncbi:hypothetical protein PV325_006013 [Microctonus aethiopoides]|nr:hypothetical protein PV325_006013 [Microctonus aethiopoides]